MSYSNRIYTPNGTTLKDLIHMLSITTPDLEPPYAIMYRITVPDEELFDTLFGYCMWDGYELKPLDGDAYYLDDEIVAYEVFDTNKRQKMLSVTVEGERLYPDGSWRVSSVGQPKRGD